MNGWIETREQIESRWSARMFEGDKITMCLMQTTEAQADKLHELFVTCNTDPAHIAHATMQDWGETSVEYKQSQPYHNDLYPYV